MSANGGDSTQSTYQIYQNVLAWRGCEQLYLNERTADVRFVFASSGSGPIEKVPAHKAILSAISPVLDALLYGPFKQDGDINIDGTTIQAFREFLQFFYIRNVKITSENVVAVMDLAKRYAVADCLNACADFQKTTLTIDNMCWGYELAIQFEHQSLQQFCEQKICENASNFFGSSSFLHCKLNLLRVILHLNGFQCDESVIFDGYIEWAKHKCIKNQLDETDVKNIRKQLGDLFYEIRFAGMTIKQLYSRARKYDGLFSQQEFHDIIGIIADSDTAADAGQLTSKFNRTPRKSVKPPTPLDVAPILPCSRVDLSLSSIMKRYVLPPIDCTAFSSTCALKLTKIYCSEIFSAGAAVESIPFGIKVIEMTTNQMGTYGNGNVMYFRQMALNPIVSTAIEFPTPILIEANRKYGIVLQFQWWNSSCFNLLVYKPVVEINDNISIEFYDVNNDYEHDFRRFGLITQMDFIAV